MIIHPFEPVYNKHSRILILGTFPSVISREENFYYGYTRNRFWSVISILTGNPLPLNIDEKKNLLHNEKIAVWDVLKSCDIDQSKDSSIINPIPNDLNGIFDKSNIKAVFTNGRKAEELYERLCYPITGFKGMFLPSTSPANAGYSLEKLLAEWSVILKFLK